MKLDFMNFKNDPYNDDNLNAIIFYCFFGLFILSLIFGVFCIFK